MKLELSFSKLVEAVRHIAGSGYRPLTLTTDLPPLPPRGPDFDKQPLGEPPVIKVDSGPIDWEEFEQVEGNGGLLQKQGQQVMMYMRGHYSATFHQALQDGVKGNKVHVAFCSKLEEMKRTGRLDNEYFLSQALEGKFLITERHATGEGNAELKVCKLCLRKLNYKGYLAPGRGKGNIFEKFSYENFFEEYESFFPSHPMRDKESNRGRGYTEDWAEISRNYRSSQIYTCEECRVDLNSHRHLLHTHHINAVKNDNREENLRALCIDCHSKQPRHDHMIVRLEDRHLIAHLRKQQHMPPPEDWREVFCLADPGLNGVLHHLKTQQGPLPEIGLDIQDASQAVVANLELAWTQAQLAVAIGMEDIEAARREGWNVYSVEQALTEPEKLLAALRQSRCL